MSVCIDGKKIAQEMKESMKKYLTQKGEDVNFDIIYVGLDPVIDNFIKYKKRFGRDINVKVHVHKFDKDISQNDLAKKVKELDIISKALIIQLPLPIHINTQDILDLVNPEKDVDLLAQQSQVNFKDGTSNLLPAVTGSIIKIFEYYNIQLMNKNIVVIGSGNLVGKPIQLWLERENYAYSLILKNTQEREKKEKLHKADIIISGVGDSYIVNRDDIKTGSVLIDAGTSESGKKITGDIHPECYDKSSFHTPVPGGIGPLTIALLYRNILYAHKHYYDK